jgi:hypothetical protein
MWAETNRSPAAYDEASRPTAVGRVVDLRHAVEASSIVQADHTVACEALRCSDHGRARNRDVVSDTHATQAEPKARNRKKSRRSLWVTASSTQSDQVTATRTIHSGYVFHEGLFPVGGLAIPKRRGGPAYFHLTRYMIEDHAR